ncbi:MAG TPA: growth inhibitor PemK [Phenylobacterium sp.]|jgi:hypothetical protein|nr:growth inhibitor PemK [Phenylobacterium sp.]
MTFPAPKPGLVICYSFLWSDEHADGADEGSKDRPCAIVVAAENAAGDIRTLVAPITHSPPKDPQDSIEMPASVCRALGLDGARHWPRLDELNRFSWPGYDLRPIPGTEGEFAYGLLPRDLFEQLRSAILERQRAKKGRVVGRD